MALNESYENVAMPMPEAESWRNRQRPKFRITRRKMADNDSKTASLPSVWPNSDCGGTNSVRVRSNHHLDARMDAIPVREADDARLVARCLGGDRLAWAELVRRYQRLIFAIVSRMGLDQHTCEDVFQTVFARLYKNLPRIGDPNRLQAWIVTTTKREALLQRQRGLRMVSTTSISVDGVFSEQEFTDESPGAEQLLDQLQQHHQVREAMNTLDDRCRELLLLLFKDTDDKLSYDEVADRLNISVGSIGPTRARCLQKLRHLLSAAS